MKEIVIRSKVKLESLVTNPILIHVSFSSLVVTTFDFFQIFDFSYFDVCNLKHKPVIMTSAVLYKALRKRYDCSLITSVYHKDAYFVAEASDRRTVEKFVVVMAYHLKTTH